MDKDLRKILDAAEDQGFRVDHTASGHPRIYRGDAFVTTFSGTPGDVRGIRNGIAAMRRHGFVWPPGRKPKRKD